MLGSSSAVVSTVTLHLCDQQLGRPWGHWTQPPSLFFLKWNAASKFPCLNLLWIWEDQSTRPSQFNVQSNIHYYCQDLVILFSDLFLFLVWPLIFTYIHCISLETNVGHNLLGRVVYLRVVPVVPGSWDRIQRSPWVLLSHHHNHAIGMGSVSLLWPELAPHQAGTKGTSTENTLLQRLLFLSYVE